MIDMTKTYKLRGFPESEVIILAVDIDGEYPVVARINLYAATRSWQLMTFTAEGVFSTSGSCDFDLVEVSPYADFKIDEPVMVSDTGADWVQRYFAGIASNGVALCWVDGRTSWTAVGLKGNPTSWQHCRRPTQEELGNDQ